MYETCKVQLVRNCLQVNNGSEEKRGLSPMEKLVAIKNVKAALRPVSKQTGVSLLMTSIPGNGKSVQEHLLDKHPS